MPTVHEVHQNLVDSQLMSTDEADRQVAAWRAESGVKNDEPGVALADWLVEQSQLTELQAEAIKAGHKGPFMLGPYRVQQRLAAGTLGNVYRAVHVELDQPVSLKVFPRQLKDNEEQLARMQREARASVEFDHPNIVRTFQVGRAGDIYYLAFQDLQGETLQAKLDREGALEPAEAARLMRDAAQALAHLHERGFVHRDVRPANMWVTSGGVLKLMEFGGVSAAVEGLEEDDVTTSDTVIGSIDYMAPEQAADAHSADHRSDIYSLGCTLYHCLAGEKPFREKNPIRLAMKHAMELPPALKDWIPGIPEKLSHAVDGMIAKSPADRFQSAQDVVWAMEEHFDRSQSRNDDAVASAEFLQWAASPTNPEHERIHEARSPELAGFMHWLADKHPAT
jgi:serine/threonine-protein kinase